MRKFARVEGKRGWFKESKRHAKAAKGIGRGKAKIVKASRYTHAKTGYLVFIGAYPTMKAKYFRTRLEALKAKKYWEK